MILTGGNCRSGGNAPGSRRLVSVAIDFPDRHRPRRSDIGDHLASYLGTADFALHGVRDGPLQVDVNIVWPTAERPWTTAYTVGASSRPMTIPPGMQSRCSPYAELFLRLPPSWVPEQVCPFCVPRRAERNPLADPRAAWPFEWLALIARQPHAAKTFLGPGHVVECDDDAPRDHGLPFAGFYLDAGWDVAGDREIPPLSRADGTRVDFFGLVALLPPEVRAFREDRGKEVLRALDAMKVTELLVPDRRSCV